MSGYTKLFNSIVTSTIWEEDKDTKIVWITMLALSGADGTVEASIPGLARMAHLSIEEVKGALEKLQSPDPYSRSKEHEGRRIREIDGGWFILNRAKYREKMNEDERREYRAKWMRESRAREHGVNTREQTCTVLTQTESETESKTETKAKARTPRARRGSLPAGFAVSDQVRAWAAEKGFDRLEERLEHFIGYAKANGKTYADWGQAFRNAIRDDWAKLKTGGNGYANRAQQQQDANIAAGRAAIEILKRRRQDREENEATSSPGGGIPRDADSGNSGYLRGKLV
jgi:hypothetical protein